MSGAFVGYSGGYTPHTDLRGGLHRPDRPCRGRARRLYLKVTYAALVKAFFEAHDPAWGMRQGADVGTQYRSAIYYHTDEQRQIAEDARASYDQALRKAGHPPITTEIVPAARSTTPRSTTSQYLHKVPDGYCGLGGTGVTCAMPHRSLPVSLDERGRPDPRWR